MPNDDRVKVTFKGSDEPSGLAMMMAQYFEQNIHDFPRKNTQALKTAGKLAIEAAEGDVAVTLRFTGKEIEIHEGTDADADMFVRGGIFSITELATGTSGAFKKMAGGDLEIRSGWKHPVFAFRVARFMSMPGEIMREDAGSRAGLPWLTLAIGAGGAVALGLAAYFLA